MSQTTWRLRILAEMRIHEDSFENTISSTISEEELDVEFNDGFGATEGIPFTLWTKERVYFPSCYDGAEDCESVSRDPDGIPTEHIGG